ncbi:hypothetical protein EVAR_92561_1 [Eumeta japonica]|uniref:Uncharacterized protein n=1 Tax=Eumeta variegata TaxID=151549 RepID=A0A4C1SXA8_EUMVA|nr:hypothetical protein EVAR_92561_1 [Eumeta japonica]
MHVASTVSLGRQQLQFAGGLGAYARRPAPPRLTRSHKSHAEIQLFRDAGAGAATRLITPREPRFGNLWSRIRLAAQELMLSFVTSSCSHSRRRSAFFETTHSTFWPLSGAEEPLCVEAACDAGVAGSSSSSRHAPRKPSSRGGRSGPRAPHSPGPPTPPYTSAPCVMAPPHPLPRTHCLFAARAHRAPVPTGSCVRGRVRAATERAGRVAPRAGRRHWPGVPCPRALPTRQPRPRPRPRPARIPPTSRRRRPRYTEIFQRDTGASTVRRKIH